MRSTDLELRKEKFRLDTEEKIYSIKKRLAQTRLLQGEAETLGCRKCLQGNQRQR